MTPYENIFYKFLSKIKDYTLLTIIEEGQNQEFVESMLMDYMNSAIANFTYATSRVENRDDQAKMFKDKLTNLEEEIIAKLMVVEYLNPYLISSDKLESKLSSKDFNSWSPANLMGQISEIQEKERNQATELMVENYYRGKV